MNLFVTMGRLTADPEISTSGSGTKIARFRIAVNRSYHPEGSPEADFFQCVSFGKQAETIERLVHKGMKLLISGEMQNNNWTDRDGVQRYGFSYVVSNFEFCEKREQAPEAPAPVADQDGFMQLPDGVDDEGLPFN